MLLSDAEPMPNLAEPILEILYRPTSWYRVTYWALEAFLRHCQDADTRTIKLEGLLSAVYAGRLDDSDNQIAGAALERLYPSVVGPADVWRHLTRAQPSNYFGTHFRFWSRLAEEERSSDADVAALLDTLPQHVSDLRAVLDSSRLATVAAQLLVRGLDAIGANLTPTRLYDWLSAPVACQSYADTQETKEQHRRIAAWFENHPGAYKHAFREGLRRGEDNDPPSRVVRATRQRLYEAKPPDDFGSWCLDEAETFADSQPALARWLFRHVQTRFKEGETGISQGRLDERVQRHPSWQPEPEDPELAQEFRDAERKYRESKKAFEEQREKEKQQWLRTVRKEVPALHENRGAPWLLERLGREWFARSSSEEICLQDWLREEFDPSEDLAAAALQGLRGALDRPDMPEPDKILSLYSESRVHRLSVPFLAALHERDQEAPKSVDQLTRLQQRQALALHYCVPTDWGRRPAWYDRLAQQSPEVAASVLLPFARAQIRSGRNHVAGLWELAHDQHHAELARLLSLPLLRGFPVRGGATQSGDLCLLLWAALQHADREKLRALIALKLAARSMTVAQRATWLGAALIADPHTYAGPLEKFIDGVEQRARQVADFLWFEFFLRPEELLRPEEDLPPQAVETLIRQLGRAGIFQNDFQQSPDPTSGRLGSLTDLLAAAPEPEAASALRRLANDESLSEWRPNLLLAIDRQTVVGRDASYKRPELAAIRATLDNAAPANAADLAALALDRLDELAKTIRNSDTNDWRQYWNHDTNGQPTTPNAENPCRDALLRQLRPLLPDAITLPEAPAPSSRRADVGLYCADLNVPIEAKKQSHKALWRAARDQLVAKYAQDPATGGYGIYVVFWFSDQERTPPDETGTRPSSADELQQRLEAGLARQLPPDQLRKIAVRVIDVSKP